MDKKELLEKVAEYNASNPPKIKVIPGKDYIQVCGHVFDEKELFNGVEAVIDGLWAFGNFGRKFESKFAEVLGAKHLKATTSGSSANRIAFTALSSHLLGEKAVKAGDEIITTASTFPTTVNPIISNNCIPVFVDIEQSTYNAKVEMLEEAFSEKTKAIVLVHTLGNPFDLKKVTEFAEEHDLWLIEDSCDSLGSEYDGKKVGSFGHLATFSCYPAHHITMGEGGAIAASTDTLARAVTSLRDWGRDCICLPGKENTCGKRFSQQFGTLPFGYDHKYVYSHIGYNLKPTEMQCAIGLAQLEKLPFFTKKRRENFAILKGLLKEFKDFLILPESTKNSNPSWFAFPITVRKDAGFERKQLTDFLEENKIGTRPLFGGNITRQPYFIDYKVKYKIVGNLEVTDFTMNNTFWIGLHPRLSKEHFEFMHKVFTEFFKTHKKS